MVEVFTLPAVITATLPSLSSRAVAPASVYVLPWVTVTGLAPFKVMTGAVVSGVITTLTVLVFVEVLFTLSFAV